jgi:hygromycin-B 4-O-kinase
MKHYIVTLDEAKSFLEKHFQSKAHSVEALNGGDWSAAYAYVLKNKEYVIRFAATDEDFKKDKKVGDYATATLHVPRIVEIGEALSGYFAISERNHGIFLDDLDADQMRRTLPSLLRSLDEIREIDLSGTKGYGWWEAEGAASCATWQEYFIGKLEDKPGDRTHGWRKKLESSPIGTESFDKAQAGLETLIDDLPSERHLLHTDFLYRNVLVQNDEISVLIDWGNSMYGDFLYDIAQLIYWWPWFPAWKDINIKQEILNHYAEIGLKIPNLEKRLLCYQIHIGLDAQKYSAFTERWDYLKQNTEQTLSLLE